MLSWVLNVAWYASAWPGGRFGLIIAVLAIGQRLLLRLPGWPVAVAGWWGWPRKRCGTAGRGVASPGAGWR